MTDYTEARKRKLARKRSAEDGILQQLFREAKAQGLAVAIHDGYGDDYLSEFGGRESGFVKASREVEDVAVHVKMPDGEVHWLAWIVWGNDPHEMFASYSVGLLEPLFPGTIAKVKKAEEVSD